VPKRLIVCCDGTWNAVEAYKDGQPVSTNVSMLATAFAPLASNVDRQMVFYMEGVGSADDERIIGGAFGWGLSANVLRGYQFLVRNYDPDDAIYLFGFSRGAFTARSLAGMIGNCGLLRRDALAVIPEALALYSDRNELTEPNSIRARIFRQMHSHEVQIEMVGVWDTVGRMGVPGLGQSLAKALEIGSHFHNVQLGTHIRRAYHAVAIHERRGTFPPALWEKNPDAPATQVLEQRWFPGVHSDVGGGYIERGLSDLALDWMAQMCAVDLSSAGFQPPLKLRPAWQQSIGCQPNPTQAPHDSYTQTFRWIDRVSEWRWFKSPKGCPRCPDLHNLSQGQTLDPSVRVNFHAHPEAYPPDFDWT
jgi:uncharacterized protein (DUF2235 family)